MHSTALIYADFPCRCSLLWHNGTFTLCVCFCLLYCVIHMTNQLLFGHILLSNLMDTKLVKIISDNIKFLIKFVDVERHNDLWFISVSSCLFHL